MNTSLINFSGVFF